MKWTTEEIVEFFMQIITAIVFLESNKISHCNIKPNNILVKFDNL